MKYFNTKPQHYFKKVHFMSKNSYVELYYILHAKSDINIES